MVLCVSVIIESVFPSRNAENIGCVRTSSDQSETCCQTATRTTTTVGIMLAKLCDLQCVYTSMQTISNRRANGDDDDDIAGRASSDVSSQYI